MTDTRAAVTLTIRGAAEFQEDTIEIIAQWLDDQLAELRKMNKKYAEIYEADFFTMEATFDDPQLFQRMMAKDEVEMGHA